MKNILRKWDVLTPEKKQKLAQEIIDYFENERDQKIGLIAAEEILDFLVRTGICERNGAKYKPGTTFVYIGNDSPFVVKHHTNWRMKAIQKMDSRESQELFFSSPMSMSLEDFAQIREILAKGIQKSLEICKDSPAKEVVCLNIDLFRLANDN